MSHPDGDKHHFVPQSYLRRWADAGEVRVVTIATGRRARGGVGVTAMKRGFYAVDSNRHQQLKDHQRLHHVPGLDLKLARPSHGRRQLEPSAPFTVPPGSLPKLRWQAQPATS